MKTKQFQSKTYRYLTSATQRADPAPPTNIMSQHFSTLNSLEHTSLATPWTSWSSFVTGALSILSQHTINRYCAEGQMPVYPSGSSKDSNPLSAVVKRFLIRLRRGVGLHCKAHCVHRVANLRYHVAVNCITLR